jgi:hypothetical protein
LTVGTADANGRAASSIGSVQLVVVPGDPNTPQNEADVQLVASMTDVLDQSDLSDYAGELEVVTTLRITDRDNADLSGAGAPGPGTVSDTALRFTVPCSPTPESAAGGTCAIATSADAVAPGIARERQRAVWEIDAVSVRDGGEDGLTSTEPNALFARQGLFVP